jgi:hypothetical protein
MVSLKTTIDPQSMAKISAALTRLQRDTGRTAAEAVSYAGYQICTSAARKSKPSKPKREIRENQQYKAAAQTLRWAQAQKRKGKAIPAYAQEMLSRINDLLPWHIVVMRQGGNPPALLGRYEKPTNDPARQVEQRGLARKIWTIMAAKSADSTRSAGARHYRVSKYTDRWGTTAGQHVVRLVNRLSYVEQAFPGIVTAAISSATAGINGYIDRQLKQRLHA